MNYTILRDYIKQYKDRFTEIHKKEIYKWKATKHFEDHWNIDAVDFVSMLKESLSQTKNLLSSGDYLPRRTLNLVCKEDPESVRELFRNLFDQTKEIEGRVQKFREDFIFLKVNNIDKPNHYQDDRAIMVYLSLRYPKEYFFYKFKMFEAFSKLIDYSYNPVIGRIQNIKEFQQLCEIVREELLEDNDLVNMHHKRLIDSKYYQDPSYTILTQDFIYACVKHLNRAETVTITQVDFEMEEAEIRKYQVNISDPHLKGRHVDFNKLQSNNSRIGKAGEHFILDREREKLEKLGVKNIKKKLEHSSVIQGDGIGYDIKSLDDNGNEIFIEVKATTSNFKTPFYITRNELFCSQKFPEKYRLYRLYNFDPKKNKGKVIVFKGDLTAFCSTPVNYQITLTKKDNL